MMPTRSTARAFAISTALAAAATLFVASVLGIGSKVVSIIAPAMPPTGWYLLFLAVVLLVHWLLSSENAGVLLERTQKAAGSTTRRHPAHRPALVVERRGDPPDMAQAIQAIQQVRSEELKLIRDLAQIMSISRFSLERSEEEVRSEEERAALERRERLEMALAQVQELLATLTLRPEMVGPEVTRSLARDLAHSLEWALEMESIRETLHLGTVKEDEQKKLA